MTAAVESASHAMSVDVGATGSLHRELCSWQWERYLDPRRPASWAFGSLGSHDGGLGKRRGEPASVRHGRGWDRKEREVQMGWDFPTELVFPQRLDWMDRFVGAQSEPLEVSDFRRFSQPSAALRAQLDPLEPAMKDRGCGLPPGRGGEASSRSGSSARTRSAGVALGTPGGQARRPSGARPIAVARRVFEMTCVVPLRGGWPNGAIPLGTSRYGSRAS